MKMFKDYKSPLGYEVGEDGIDSYGVNHNGFSTRDEVEYQVARNQREQQLIQDYNNQGITENYPQYGTNFWGDNAYNNYGFGNSDISGNVQNVTNKLNGTDYSVLPDYSIGSASGYNNYANYSATDYTVNTENLMGKPSSYFQDNSSVGWSGNTDGFGSSTNSGFNQNTNFGASSSYGTTPTLQTQIPSPWSGNAIPPNTYKSQSISYQDMMPNAGRQFERRKLENEFLMNGMDALYGANRALNGMSFGGLDWLGNKYGFDSQMNNYLQLKNPQERELAQTAGNIAQLGGGALSGSAIVKAGLNQANMAYNGYKIGKKYDQLIEDPFQGRGSDVIARMKNHNGEPAVFQRGEITRDPNGYIVASGKYLKENTGSKSNFGLNKGIYKHGISREDAQRIPRIIQKQPVKTNEYGQYEYVAQSKKGPFKVVTSPKNGENIIATTYYINR